ncbi:uncharacterized protein [Typha latifolia]|uniref:uncharacterized protein isoform X2 n=1 Tax=Typha latifolia TaxID=4733 RepID=UPI003C2F3AE8
MDKELSPSINEQTPPRIPTNEKPSTGLRRDGGGKTAVTPVLLQIPKLFKFPERSPTDLIISPVSKSLRSRTRQGSSLPTETKSSSKSEEVGLFGA